MLLKTMGPRNLQEERKKLSAKQERLLVRKASSGKFSANKLRTELNITVSKNTVIHYLNARLKVPALQEHHKVARVRCAKTMLSNNIIVSDEKKFNLGGPDGYQWYWHDLRLEKSFYSRNHGAGTVMIWAGISHDGLTNLAFLQGKQKSSDYIKVLENNLLPFAERMYGASCGFCELSSLWLIPNPNSWLCCRLYEELRAVEIVVILVSSERAKKADDSCISECASGVRRNSIIVL